MGNVIVIGLGIVYIITTVPVILWLIREIEKLNSVYCNRSKTLGGANVNR